MIAQISFVFISGPFRSQDPEPHLVIMPVDAPLGHGGSSDSTAFDDRDGFQGRPGILQDAPPQSPGSFSWLRQGLWVIGRKTEAQGHFCHLTSRILLMLTLNTWLKSCLSSSQLTLCRRNEVQGRDSL